MTITYMFWREMEPQTTTDRGAGKVVRAKSQWLGCKCDYCLGLRLCQGGCFTSYFSFLAKGDQSVR